MGTNKRFSKSGLILLGIIMICFALGFGLSAYNLFVKTSGSLRFLWTAMLGLVSVFSLIYGLIMLIVSAGMNYGFKTYKDTNPVIDNTNVRICINCGRKLDKKADYCIYCGEKYYDEHDTKICPTCKAKNKPSAHYCERCGSRFEE